MRKVIYDIEANSLTPSRIWCVIVKDIKTSETFSFLEADKDKFKSFCEEEIETFIGHNIIQYDNYWLNKLWGTNITTEESIDTLVLSRMFNAVKEVRGKLVYTRKKNEHSLQAWGDGICAEWVDGTKTEEVEVDHEFYCMEQAVNFAVETNNEEDKSASLPKINYDEDFEEEAYVVTVTETNMYEVKVNKYAKIEFNDYDKYTPEMLTYCKQDVELNHEVWKVLVKESRGFSKQSIRLEHKLQEILCGQMRNGFLIDVVGAKRLLRHCTSKCEELETQMQSDFPPLPKLKKTYTPRLNKDDMTHNAGSMGFMKEYYGFQYMGEPYSYIEWVIFNLSSPSQVVARLEGHWSPTEKTKGGAFTLSDKNLATIRDSAPESIKKIKLYRMYSSRCNELKQWIEGAEKHEDRRLRGRIIHLGSWSGRASHSSPNTANIASVNLDKDDNIIMGEAGNFGYECRSLWKVKKGNVLVGCDASGIQLRILAHYLNNPKYTEVVISPKPNDVHTFNAKILGAPRRDSKKFIYSWLLGAGVGMTADILSCPMGSAVNKRERFVKETPGLEEFLKIKSLMAQRGWFKGLDGRKVYLPNDHLTLTAYLQNGEHVIMALANIFWDKWARQAGIPFWQCGYIHDEWQVETPEEYGDQLGRLMKKSFRVAGEFLNLNCPLDGAYNIGRNWAETH